VSRLWICLVSTRNRSLAVSPDELRSVGTCSEQESPFRKTAEWKHIVAKADSIQVRGHAAFIRIAAARRVCPKPSAHDVLNSQITTWVFWHQPLFNSVRTAVPVLYDDMGQTVSVGFNPLSVDEWLTAALPVNEQNPVAMPSPLAAFFVHRKYFEFGGLIYCKSENSP